MRSSSHHRVVALALTLAALTACTDPAKLVGPEPRSPLIGVECPIRDPPPGCPGSPVTRTYINDTNYRVFRVPTNDPAYAASLPTSNLPPWPTIDNPEEAAGPWVCPLMDREPLFFVWVEQISLMALFGNHGWAVKLGDLPPSTRFPGHPRARYSMPVGWTYSILPRGWSVSGGTLDGTCWYKTFRNVFYGEMVYVGWMVWDVAQGYVVNPIVDSGNGGIDPFGGSTGESGYAFGSRGGGYGGGRSSGGGGGATGAQAAFNRWFQYGTCSPGWAIWVDGAEVCSGI